MCLHIMYINVDGHIYVCSALLFKINCSSELYSYFFWSTCIYSCSDEIVRDEIRWTCSEYCEQQNCIQDCGRYTRRKVTA